MIQENKNSISKILFGALLTIITIGILYLLVGCIRTNPDKILERNAEYILVKEYKWNNRDSVIYKYPADKIYTGVVIDKERTSRYVGVPGKGGHPDVDYYVTIKFNNQIFKTDDYQLYHKYNKGNNIKVKEVWYPRHKIIVL